MEAVQLKEDKRTPKYPFKYVRNLTVYESSSIIRWLVDTDSAIQKHF